MISLLQNIVRMKQTILMFVLALLTTAMWSQSSEDRLQRLLEDDPETLNPIIAAEPAVQVATFEAATRPDILSQLQRIQDRSRAEFEGIVKPYSQETQQLFWDLTRYPKLVSRLATEGKGSEIAIREILRDYPDIIHPRAKEASQYYYNLLVEINDLDNRTNQEFNQLLNDYPRDTQAAFRKLIDNPEALSALGQNKNTTEELAALYKKDANWTLNRFSDLNRERNTNNTQELQDWKTDLQSDPEAVNELTASAQTYSKEYGYDDEYYGEDFEEPVYYESSRQTRPVVRNYYTYNYPYWFGYPRWYRAPRWRPVPVWYDYGFYYNPGRPIVFIQMPSFYFVNWYFYRPYHHYQYARLSSCFVDYYYRHPRSYNTIVINVNSWKYRNRAVVGDDWLRDRDHRVERLREFGKFEEERRDYNRDNRSRAISQRDYLDKNEAKYANLTKVAPRNADRNTFPEREGTLENLRRSDATTQSRTREAAHERQRTEQTPERTATMPRRTETTSEPRTRTREEVQPRENPVETTPRRSTQPEQTRSREQPTQQRETQQREPIRREEPRNIEQPRTREQPTEQRQTQQREPIRREEPRTIERRPEPQQRAPQTQERTRTAPVERSRSTEPSKQVERSRGNNSANTQQKGNTAKKEEAPRKRGNE